jgi:hypothetical protein
MAGFLFRLFLEKIFVDQISSQYYCSCDSKAKPYIVADMELNIRIAEKDAVSGKCYAVQDNTGNFHVIPQSFI